MSAIRVSGNEALIINSFDMDSPNKKVNSIYLARETSRRSDHGIADSRSSNTEDRSQFMNVILTIHMTFEGQLIAPKSICNAIILIPKASKKIISPVLMR
jgi:hypothetical protein